MCKGLKCVPMMMNTTVLFKGYSRCGNAGDVGFVTMIRPQDPLLFSLSFFNQANECYNEYKS